MGEKNERSNDVEVTATGTPPSALPAPSPVPTSPTSPASDKQPTPFFTLEWWLSWLQEKFGRRTALVILAAAFVVFVGWNIWDSIKEWPGLRSIRLSLVEARLPQPKRGFFNVGIAHLARDGDREQEQELRAALQELRGVNVAIFDRTIVIAGEQLQDALQQAHAEAHRYLENSGFDAVLWGEVLGSRTNASIKLYWTLTDKGYCGEPLTLNQNQTLPELFWGELVEVLRLLVTASEAALQMEQGSFIADRVQPFVDRVRNLLSERSRKGWSPATTAQVQAIFAKALTTLGEQTGGSNYLVEAIASYREVLKEYTRERVPLDWAMTQNNLGNALSSLGERESGTVHLEEAINAYREALKEYTRERAPIEWAAIQNNLGTAVSSLGERESGTARLEEAVNAYREALKEYTRERAPLQWAKTQNNLGVALQEAGARESGTARLQEAVNACREALKERPRERVPLDWAATESSLGDALRILGARESGTARLEEAVNAYREALKEYTRERAQFQWAMTQHNLGTALLSVGERESGTVHLEEAIDASREALASAGVILPPSAGEVLPL